MLVLKNMSVGNEDPTGEVFHEQLLANLVRAGEKLSIGERFN